MGGWRAGLGSVLLMPGEIGLAADGGTGKKKAAAEFLMKPLDKIVSGLERNKASDTQPVGLVVLFCFFVLH